MRSSPSHQSYGAIAILTQRWIGRREVPDFGQRSSVAFAFATTEMPRKMSAWNQLHKECVGIDKHRSEASLAAALHRIKVLATYGHDVDVRTSRMNTPLHLACSQTSPDLIELLLSLGANPAAENSLGETPLHHCMMHGNIEMVDLLLDEEGVDVNKRDATGCTPLHWALQRPEPSLAIVERLLERGANPNVPDQNGDCPLHYAAQEGYLEGIDALLMVGADATRVNDQGFSPFHLACQVGQRAVVEGFLELNESPLLVAPSYQHHLTPLHLAARSESKSVFDLLLAVDDSLVSKPDAYGRTPLHIAAKEGNNYVTGRLLEEGADRTAVDCFERTPAEYAKEGHHSDVANMLGQ